MKRSSDEGTATGPYANPPRLPDGQLVEIDAFIAPDGPLAGGPLEIEIGPGRGAFIVARCQQLPDVRLLGFEIRRKWATLVDERLERLGHGARARVVCEDARLALPRLMPDGSVARVFIHFPDPWWKKRHRKRLVVVDSLIAQIGRLLASGGELFVQTDVLDRADEYEQRIRAETSLEPAGDEPGSARLAANPYGVQGNRERRVTDDGLPVHRLRFKRK